MKDDYNTTLTWDEIGSTWQQGTHYIRQYWWHKKDQYYKDPQFGDWRVIDRGHFFQYYYLRKDDLVTVQIQTRFKNPAHNFCKIKSYPLNAISPQFKLSYARETPGNVQVAFWGRNAETPLFINGVTFGKIAKKEGMRKEIDNPDVYEYARSYYESADYRDGLSIVIGTGDAEEFRRFLDKLLDVLDYHRQIAAGYSQLKDVKGEFIIPENTFERE